MIKSQTFSLSKHQRKKAGKNYIYWYLCWFGSDGRQHGQSIGRANGLKKISKRQAELLRSRKEQELNKHPGRRDMVSAPVLFQFLDDYLASRVSEIAPGTLELHKQTVKYL